MPQLAASPPLLRIAWRALRSVLGHPGDMSHPKKLPLGLAFAALLAVSHPLSACSVAREGTAIAPDYGNGEYEIEGRRIRLVEGVSKVEPAPGSATTIATRSLGNPLRKDLDGDGRPDAVFFLSQETGGSGMFFYVAAALATNEGDVGSKAMLLGDRIAPQAIESGRDNIVIVHFADRAAGEPLSAAPTLRRSRWLLLDPTTLQFGEVAQDFEGEADPARMRLDMTTWRWIRTEYSDGREVVPRQPGKFALTLSADGSFSATTDCNQLQGAYTTDGDTISVGPIASTRMFCADSQEGEFSSALGSASRYRFTSHGELVFTLDSDRGSIVFR